MKGILWIYPFISHSLRVEETKARLERDDLLLGICPLGYFLIFNVLRNSGTPVVKISITRSFAPAALYVSMTESEWRVPILDTTDAKGILV